MSGYIVTSCSKDAAHTHPASTGLAASENNLVPGVLPAFDISETDSSGERQQLRSFLLER